MFGEERLDDAIFQRVKRNNDQPSAGLQDPFRRRQGSGEFGQFLIDEDSQRLERARRRMNRARLGAHHTLDNRHQFFRGA